MGKKSNSMIAVTRDKVIVFSVGVGGEICGEDLVNITGAGVNWVSSEPGLGLVSYLVWEGETLLGSVATPGPAVVVY